MSLRICRRAAPRPSERLTPSMLTASPANRRPEMSFMGSTASAKVSASSHRNETLPWRQACVRSYGLRGTFYHIVALGDSLTAGLGLPAKDGFVPRLQAALAAQGAKVEITNAGVSGDTASDGLARLDWSVPEGTDGAIVELGANDMLHGIDPQVTRDALDAVLARLAQRHIAVMLCGMKAAPNLGADYGRAFERIYAELAAKYGAVFYPFFLDGAVADRTLTQQDGMHPNAAGVAVMVRRILPAVQEFIARVRAQKQS